MFRLQSSHIIMHYNNLHLKYILFINTHYSNLI